jgi:uncharacterized membrane-anchored protein
MAFSAGERTVSPLARYLASPTLRKVPAITLSFWIVKLLTTAMGEATSDYLVFNVNKYAAVLFGGVGLVLALWLQLRARRYVPWIYWFAVTMVAVFGTMAADVLHVVLGIPYLTSTVFFAAALAVIFGLWYRTERDLSIHHIDTHRRELFYWAAVIATFALGTAAGDLAAATFGLGYLAAGIFFAVLFLAPGLAHWRLRLNAIAAFWWAYIVTRPLGASFADWFGKSSLGGLGFGDGAVALVLTFAIVVGVAFLTLRQPPATVARLDGSEQSEPVDDVNDADDLEAARG